MVITAELDTYTGTIKLHSLMVVLCDRQVHLTERIKASTAASVPWEAEMVTQSWEVLG